MLLPFTSVSVPSVCPAHQTAELRTLAGQVHASEALLNSTVSQLSELEASASSIRFASEGAEQPQQPSASTSSSSTSVAPVQAATQTQATSPLPTDQALQRRYSSQTKRRRLHSSLALPATLHQFWYPAEFSSQLKKRSIIPLELFHEPWVLFRGADGKAACIRDTCAHQTCPLSLGHVVNEQVRLHHLNALTAFLRCATSFLNEASG